MCTLIGSLNIYYLASGGQPGQTAVKPLLHYAWVLYTARTFLRTALRGNSFKKGLVGERMLDFFSSLP